MAAQAEESDSEIIAAGSGSGIDMNVRNSLKDQVQRNMVALISLVVAITSLSYNTWRNEVSEENRTQRLVSIEVLMRLGDLQQLVWHHHWDKDFEDKGNLRTGWTLVLVMRDISQILDDPLPASTESLLQVWEQQSEGLDTSREAEQAIIAAISNVRSDALALLQKLD